MASKSDSKQVIVRIAGVFDAFVRTVSAYEEDLRRDVAPSGAMLGHARELWHCGVLCEAVVGGRKRAVGE